jgi:hypothetical protein
VNEARPRVEDPSEDDQTVRAPTGGRLDGLSTIVVVLLAIMAILSGFLSVAFYNSSSVISESLAYDENGEVQAHAARVIDEAESLLGWSMRLFLLGVLVTGPLFIAWQYRHARGAERLSPQTGVARAPWAIGGWFVPIANLWLPGMQIYRSSKASDPRVASGESSSAGEGNEKVKAWAWALALSVAGSVLAGGAEPDPYALMSESEYIDALSRADLYRSLGALGLAVAAILGVVMVRELTQAQTAKLRTVSPSDTPE